MSFNLNIPVNSVSFGSVSIALAREFYKKKLCPNVFLIGGADMSAQKEDGQFSQWLQSGINKSLKSYSRESVNLKLWHINQSLESLSDRRFLYTFHETDRITDEEINILKNQDRVFVSSSYTKQVFEEGGLDNVVFAPLGFDSHNFFKTNKTYHEDGVIFWGHISKFEERKKTRRILQLWVKKYGNNRKHFLNIACYNPFFRKQDGQSLNQDEFKQWLIQTVFGGVNYWNVNFVQYMKTNAEVNDMINSFDIAIGVAGNEGFDLGLFHAAALGKHVVSLNAHVYKDYLNDSNAVLIQPSSMTPASDGMFFHPGQPFNQGFWFDWKDEDFTDALEVAESHYLKSKVNFAGMELQKQTYTQTADIILKEMENVDPF